ncbi:hypothetical protein D3C83_72550 [compost metagenome]
MPTGGVMSPSSTSTSARMPNHTLRSSGLMPKSRTEITGQKNGMASRIMDRLSIRQPRMMRATISTNRIIIGERPEFVIIEAAACGTPPRAMKMLSSCAPSRIR